MKEEQTEKDLSETEPQPEETETPVTEAPLPLPVPVQTENEDDDTDAEDDGILMHWQDDEDDGEDKEAAEKADSSEAGNRQKKEKHKKKEKKEKKKKNKDTEQSVPYADADDGEDDSAKKKRKKTKKRKTDKKNTVSEKETKPAKRLKTILLHRVLPISLLAAFLLGFVLYFFRLKKLTFDNLNIYDPEDVYASINVKKDMFIFEVNSDSIKKTLASRFPYIADVDVEIEFPDTVHLVFSSDYAAYYTEIFDQYFIISTTLRVLGRCATTEELPTGLRKIVLPSVSYAVVGYELRFFDENYKSDVLNFLSVMSAADIYEKVTYMDISSRNYLNIGYEKRLNIDLGSFDDLEIKLMFVKSILPEIDADDTGTLKLITNKQATFSEADYTEP